MTPKAVNRERQLILLEFINEVNWIETYENVQLQFKLDKNTENNKKYSCCKDVQLHKETILSVQNWD